MVMLAKQSRTASTASPGARCGPAPPGVGAPARGAPRGAPGAGWVPPASANITRIRCWVVTSSPSSSRIAASACGTDAKVT